MAPGRSTAGELTRRLLAQWSGPDDSAQAAAAAARDACDAVSAEFSRWVGPRGYEALLSRAMAEVRATHPALAEIRFAPPAQLALIGVDDSIERFGAAATARAFAALLEAILALCVRLIGDDIVTTLVEKTMEHPPRGAAGHNRNLESRTGS